MWPKAAAVGSCCVELRKLLSRRTVELRGAFVVVSGLYLRHDTSVLLIRINHYLSIITNPAPRNPCPNWLHTVRRATLVPLPLYDLVCGRLSPFLLLGVRAPYLDTSEARMEVSCAQGRHVARYAGGSGSGLRVTLNVALVVKISEYLLLTFCFSFDVLCRPR